MDKYGENYGDNCDPGLAARIEKRMNGQISADDFAVLKEWREAKSYKEILALNVAYLRGEREICPYQYGPAYAETTPSLPALIRLHGLGILTQNSQPSGTTGPEYGQCNCCPKWSWFWTKQRAFLSFMIPRDVGRIPVEVEKKFIAELMHDSNVFTSIYNGVRLIHNFPEEWETHLAKKADSKVEIESDPEVTYRQIIKLDDSCATVPFATETDVMSKAQPLVIHVLARSWEEQDLVGLVEKAAERAGMNPVYAV
ncbi:hypothetical protein LTR36_005316 [Oleoguttula mirabilis]|uniref:DUF6919 domain-containing protein n=1 Tax=Oleoguttula mirabilis TaxID=1507867 RepID=A0AAV9JF49_9PEZI|nr:hypothetical protein LTR36_005316 [Oleoguttula mirabilis]